ncbi:MAG TPA: GNAT family N-acetyltransferase, partial [Gaiellaceae bacterium]
GNGYTTRAAVLVSRYALERGAARVFLRADPENVGSCRVAEKAGFTREGVLRSAHWNERLGRRQDWAIYSLLPVEYVAPRQTLRAPLELDEYDEGWPALYAREETRIRGALGDRVVRLEHTGSTSVPGLAAKPIIDICLEVADTRDEAAYAADLEAAGYSLVLREPGWYEHRLFRATDPTVHLHVFPAGCEEVARMLAFRDHLRADAADRELYERSKRELIGRDWEYMQDYADAKSAVVADIMRRAVA